MLNYQRVFPTKSCFLGGRQYCGNGRWCWSIQLGCNRECKPSPINSDHAPASLFHCATHRKIRAWKQAQGAPRANRGNSIDANMTLDLAGTCRAIWSTCWNFQISRIKDKVAIVTRYLQTTWVCSDVDHAGKSWGQNCRYVDQPFL